MCGEFVSTSHLTSLIMPEQIKKMLSTIWLARGYVPDVNAMIRQFGIILKPPTDIFDFAQRRLQRQTATCLETLLDVVEFHVREDPDLHRECFGLRKLLGDSLSSVVFDRNGTMRQYEKCIAHEKSINGDGGMWMIELNKRCAASSENQGAFTDAIGFLKLAMQSQTFLMGPDHVDVSDTLYEIGRMQLALGDALSAMAMFDECIRIRQSVLGEFHPSVGIAQIKIGESYFSLGRIPKALEILQRALRTLTSILGDSGEPVFEAYFWLGRAFFKQKDMFDAAEQFVKALEVGQRTFGLKHVRLTVVLDAAAEVAMATQKFEIASDYLRRSVALKIREYGPMNPNVGSTMRRIGSVLEKLDRVEQALSIYQQAFPIFVNAFGRNHVETANCSTDIGLALIKLRRSADALQPLQEAQCSFDASIGSNSFKAALAHSNVGLCLREQV
jgi:tetratricopeptide (TPR) repeat protein